MATFLLSRVRSVSSYTPVLLSLSNTMSNTGLGFYSKTSEAFDNKFHLETPPKLDLLTDFYFATKKPISDLGESKRLSGFWVFNRPKTTPYPQKSSVKTQALEEINLSNYLSSVSKLISKFENKFRGIPVLYPGISGSVDRFGEIGLHTDVSSLYLLCCKLDLFPVAIRTKNKIVVINSKLFAEIGPGYSARIKKLGGFSEVEQSFSQLEMVYSMERIELAVETLASGVENGMAYGAAINTIVFMCCYGSKALFVREFFEGVISDHERAEVVVPEKVVNFAKGWGRYCKEIHAGNQTFALDGKEVLFTEMERLVILLNSRKEDRRVITN